MVSRPCSAYCSTSEIWEEHVLVWAGSGSNPPETPDTLLLLGKSREKYQNSDCVCGWDFRHRYRGKREVDEL